jgi:hypothetical protein
LGGKELAMFARLSRGWELTKESFAVLRQDKRLLLFPLFSAVASLLVTASFLLPLWNSKYAALLLDEKRLPNDPGAYVLLFLFYFVNYAVMVYFNAALVACAVLRFKGGEPGLSFGLQAANRCLPQILAWALVSATVGVILKIIESRSERVGQLVAGVLGAAWGIGTYFVVPALVVGRVGPIEAVQRSLATIRKTWGESLSANVSAGAIFFVVTLILLLPLVLGGVLVSVGIGNGSIVPLALGIALVVVLLLTISLVSSALHTILQAALYLYAAEGVVPQAMNENLLREAFTTK